MSRHHAFTLLIVSLATGCETEAAREAHDKTLMAGARQEVKAELEQLTAANFAAEAERKSTEGRIATEAKSAEDHATAGRVATLRADIGANPGKYIQFSGIVFSDDRVPQGDRHLIRVTGRNASPYALRVAEAAVVALDNAGQESSPAPLSLNGSIAPGQTKTFHEADIRSGIIPWNGRTVRVIATAVEILDVAPVAVQ